jgi:hypothetical protein
MKAMKKHFCSAALLLAGLVTAAPAFAQWGNSRFDNDSRACQRSPNFNRCMQQRGWHHGNSSPHWHHGNNWNHWNQPNWNHGNNWNQSNRNQPRLSDMQQRALNNCAFLHPSEQARCRATVWSTVR